MEYLYVLLLRLAHVAIGAFWAGSLVYLAAFVLPAIKASGPEGGKFMQTLTATNRLPLVMDFVAAISILSGILLYARASSGFDKEWITSRYGLALTLGGLSAITVYLLGWFVHVPTVKRMGMIGQEIAKSGGPPSADQLARMGALRTRLTRVISTNAALLMLSAVLMGVARYL